MRALELEKTLEVERVRLGELRRQHYLLAGATGAPGEEEPSQGCGALTTSPIVPGPRFFIWEQG